MKRPRYCCWIAGVRDPESIAEFETQHTIEARCARDADKLECLIQGITTVQHWIDNSPNALKTNPARELATDIIKANPLGWEHIRQS
jgi:putative hydrolase of HD superfamily